jgi:hypothetical protein
MSREAWWSKMPDPANDFPIKFITPPGVALKDKTVDVEHINAVLQAFLIVAGLVHMHLFNSLLTVTSGKDAKHAQSSKHYIGNAVDLRINDLPPDYQPVFILYLRVLCDRFHLALFDESNVPGAGHVHIEIAG